MSGLGTKLLAWFIRPPADKRGGQIAPPNAPVLKASREIPLPPVPRSLAKLRDDQGGQALRFVAAELRAEAEAQADAARPLIRAGNGAVEAAARAAVVLAFRDLAERLEARTWPR